MFSKLLKAASFSAFVTAQESLSKMIDMPVAEIDNVKCEGVMGESFYTEGDKKYLDSFIQWKTSSTDGSEFALYSWIQNYAQWEDEANPGKYSSVTCNVGYIPDDDYAENISVGHFYGDSISANDITTGKYDSYGTPIPEEVASAKFLWQQIDPASPIFAESY